MSAGSPARGPVRVPSSRPNARGVPVNGSTFITVAPPRPATSRRRAARASGERSRSGAAPGCETGAVSVCRTSTYGLPESATRPVTAPADAVVTRSTANAPPTAVVRRRDLRDTADRRRDTGTAAIAPDVRSRGLRGGCSKCPLEVKRGLVGRGRLAGRRAPSGSCARRARRQAAGAAGAVASPENGRRHVARGSRRARLAGAPRSRGQRPAVAAARRDLCRATCAPGIWS